MFVTLNFRGVVLHLQQRHLQFQLLIFCLDLDNLRMEIRLGTPTTQPLHHLPQTVVLNSEYLYPVHQLMVAACSSHAVAAELQPFNYLGELFNHSLPLLQCSPETADTLGVLSISVLLLLAEQTKSRNYPLLLNNAVLQLHHLLMAHRW